MITKKECYKNIFNLFLKKTVPDNLLEDLLINENSTIIELQEFVCANLKEQINWATNISIIDSVEFIYNEAKNNETNLKLKL
jgi:hypothetical protein